MSLTNSDGRRAWRTVVATGIIISLNWLMWQITGRLSDAGSLREIARWALGITGLFTLGYVMENGLRSFKWNLPGGFGGEASNDAADGADAVATAAVEKADEIKAEATGDAKEV